MHELRCNSNRAGAGASFLRRRGLGDPRALLGYVGLPQTAPRPERRPPCGTTYLLYMYMLHGAKNPWVGKCSPPAGRLAGGSRQPDFVPADPPAPQASGGPAGKYLRRVPPAEFSGRRNPPARQVPPDDGRVRGRVRASNEALRVLARAGLTKFTYARLAGSLLPEISSVRQSNVRWT